MHLAGLQPQGRIACSASCCGLSNCWPVVTGWPSGCRWCCTRSCAWSSSCALSLASCCTWSTAGPSLAELLRVVELLCWIAAGPLHLVDLWAWPDRAAASRAVAAGGHQAAAAAAAPGPAPGQAAALDRGDRCTWSTGWPGQLGPVVAPGRAAGHLAELRAQRVRAAAAGDCRGQTRAAPGRVATWCRAAGRWPPGGRAAAPSQAGPGQVELLQAVKLLATRPSC